MKPMHFLFAVTVLALLGLCNGCSSDTTNPVEMQETRDLLASETSVADWQVIYHWGMDSIPTLSVTSVGGVDQDKFVMLFSPRRYDLSTYDEVTVSYEIAIRAPERVSVGARIGYSLGLEDPQYPYQLYPFLPSTGVTNFGGSEVRFICSEARRSWTNDLTDVYLAVGISIDRFEGAAPDSCSVSIEHFSIYGVRH